MKINKLTASFGKLEKESLSFHDGLNVIYAPNESGKSTWCAFIRAMLYGIDSSERSKAGYLPDKQRYAPWSGAPMEGSMELTVGRSDITLNRSTKGKNAPMREFSATYTGTNIPIEDMTGTNAGEMLTGVSKGVFSRSAFVGQGTVAVTGSPELERRISAIVSTGEEQTSFTEADERLRQWQRQRRFNRRGMLPELEAKMDDTQRRLEDMGGSMQDVEAMERQLEKAQQDCAELEVAVNESRKRQRRESLERLNAGRAALKSSSDEHDAALSELAARKETLRNSRFGARDREELEQEVCDDLEELARLKRESKKKPSPLLAIICFILATAGAALYIRYEQTAFVIVAAVMCLMSVAMLFRFSKARLELNTIREKRHGLLKKYQVTSSTEIMPLLEKYRGLVDEVRKAEDAEVFCRNAFESAKEAQNSLEEMALEELDFSTGNSDAAVLGRELAAARTKAEQLRTQIAGINGRLAAMGDPLVLASSLSCMEEEYEIISEEYEALELAIMAMRAADNDIQSHFSPELGRVAAEYMSFVTEGRYADVLINRDFTAKARVQGDTLARDAEYLSAGTLDLMYLAVRLAVCELALPGGEACPLIIDDALVNLDPERFEQAMKLLARIAKQRQVILFTCRK